MTEIARHKIIYETLRREILRGIYSSGDTLPSENELAARFSVARPTVRKALKSLADEALIVKHQGKGSVVKGAPRSIGILSLEGTTSAVGRTELKTVMVVKPEMRGWSEAFSFAISEKEREGGCIYFERLRLVDGVPLFFDITMLPAVYFPDFQQNNLEALSLFETLRKQYGITITGGTQQILAIKADKRLQEQFKLKAGHPVLQLNRRIECSKKGVFIYSQVFCITQGYSLSGVF